MIRSLIPVIALLAALAVPGAVRAQDDAAPAAADTAPTEPIGERAEAAIEAVDVRPPHERPEPWTIPVADIELEVRPLTQEQLEARASAWLEILQDAISRRIRIDRALEATDDAGLTTELAARSAAQQEVVLAIVDRMKPVLTALEDRGGDPSAINDYIASATGQSIKLNDPVVLWAQIGAWFKSSEGGVRVGLNLLAFLGTVAAFWILSRLLGGLVAAGLKRMGRSSALLRQFLVGGTRRVTLIIGLVVAVSALGVNITPLIAAIGAAGLVIGLALQGTLSNFASGILILIYRPYDVGNVINAGGVVGKVEAMNLVSTTIVTPDNQAMVVPNNSIWNGVITNITGRATRRVDLTFGIGYGDDIGKAVEAINAEISAHPKALADPAPNVRVHELGDNSVNIIARPWAQTADYWDVYWDLMRSVKERFDQDGISIPFPQRDLHVPEAIEVRVRND